jgi:O-antigen ligase
LKIAKAALIGGTTAAVIGIVQFISQFFLGLERVYNFWAENVIVPFLGRTFSRSVLENPSWVVNIGGKNYLRATATFPDPHMLSFFLGMLIPIALALFLSEKKKIFYGAAFVLLLACDTMTFSRGGYLGLFSGIVFAIFYYWQVIGKKYKIILIGIAGIFILVLLIPNPVSTRYISSFDLKEGSNKGRIETWKQALNVIAEKPLIGTGIGNYPLAIKPTAGYREPIYAHNTYLDIAAETGIPNALIWFGILISALAALIRTAKKDILFAAFAAGIVIFSVHSLVETAIYSPVVLALFLLMISFSNLGKESSPRDKA